MKQANACIDHTKIPLFSDFCNAMQCNPVRHFTRPSSSFVGFCGSIYAFMVKHFYAGGAVTREPGAFEQFEVRRKIYIRHSIKPVAA